MVALACPEKLSELQHTAIDCRIHSGLTADNRFQNTLLAQPELRKLIVNNRIDRNRTPVQPIVESLLLRRKTAEALRLNLDEGGGIHALDERRLSPDRFRGKKTHKYGNTVFQHEH